MRVLSLAAFSIVFPLSVFAASPVSCQPTPGLSQGLNLQNFRMCVAALNACPKSGPYPNVDCMAHTLKTNLTCPQTAAITKATTSPPFTLEAQTMGNLTLITSTFPADGQIRYHVLTPQGCLIDPLRVTKVQTNWVLSPLSPPSYQISSDGQQQLLLFPTHIAKGSLAGQSLGDTVVQLTFSNTGAFWGASSLNPKAQS